jgi:four helix bundle protein
LRDFKKLTVWEKSHQLALAIYGATTKFPKEEVYGLTSQMRRAAVSIPSNIAESSGRETIPDRVRFLHVAMGSANELEYQLILARDLGFLDLPSHTKLDQLLAEVRRMLSGFVQTLKAGG